MCFGVYNIYRSITSSEILRRNGRNVYYKPWTQYIVIAGKQIKEIKWELLNTWITVLKQRGKKEKKDIGK